MSLRSLRSLRVPFDFALALFDCTSTPLRFHPEKGIPPYRKREKAKLGETKGNREKVPPRPPHTSEIKLHLAVRTRERTSETKTDIGRAHFPSPDFRCNEVVE